MIIDGHSHLFQVKWSCDNFPLEEEINGILGSNVVTKLFFKKEKFNQKK